MLPAIHFTLKVHILIKFARMLHVEYKILFVGFVYSYYTVSQKRAYHPTTNDNFDNICLIPIIFGTNITE